MVAIKEFIEQIVYVAMAVIIIELILPKGNTKKYVYIVLSLFILLNIVSPVINIIKDVDMQTIYEDVLANISGEVNQNTDDAVEVFSEYKNKKVTKELEKELLKEIKEMITNMNVEIIDIDIQLSSEYEFEKVEVTINNLEYLKEKRDDKILGIITMLEKEYDVPSNCIIITEEAK